MHAYGAGPTCAPCGLKPTVVRSRGHTTSTRVSLRGGWEARNHKMITGQTPPVRRDSTACVLLNDAHRTRRGICTQSTLAQDLVGFCETLLCVINSLRPHLPSGDISSTKAELSPNILDFTFRYELFVLIKDNSPDYYLFSGWLNRS